MIITGLKAANIKSVATHCKSTINGNDLSATRRSYHHNSLFSISALLIGIALVPAAGAANIWWDNSGAVVANVWGQTNNWATTAAGGTDPLAVPLSGDTAIFNVDGLNTAQTVAMNGSRICLGMQFTNGTGGWILQAHGSANTSEPLSIGSGGITVGAGVGPVTIAGFVSNRGTLSTILTANQTWSLSADMTCNSPLSGAFNLTKSGANTLTLGGNNTGFTGTIRSGAGTLFINNAGAITNATLDMNAADSGTVTLNNLNFGIGALTGSRDLALGTGTISIGNKGSSTTYSGVLSGTGALTKVGAGTLTLSGANFYGGTTTVSGGTLKIDAGAGGSLTNTSPYSALTLGGGTFLYDNTAATGSKSQNMGALAANTGGNDTVQINRTAAQATLLTFASFARGAGGTVNFVYNNTAGGGTLGTDYGIKITAATTGAKLSGGAFLNGADFAYVDTTASGYLRAPVYGTDSGYVTGPTLTASSDNLLTASVSGQANVTLTSLKVSGGGSVTIDMAAAQAIQCNAWLVTGGSSLSVFNGSVVKAGGGSEMVVRADTVNDSVTFGYIQDNGGSRLTKTGSGLLSVSGAGYTGATIVNSGTMLNTAGTLVSSSVTVNSGATFGGVGTIQGPVTIAAGGTLSPGNNSIGTLSITTNFTTAGTVFMKLNAGSLTADQVVGVTNASYAGSLVVSNLSGTSLAAGQVYQLFTSVTNTGNFTSITVLGTGAAGVSGTFNPTNGQLTIANAVVSTPVINQISVVGGVGGNFILQGTNGAPSTGYSIITATNLTIPRANWTTATTGTFGAGGTFSNGIPVGSEPARFFQIKTP